MTTELRALRLRCGAALTVSLFRAFQARRRSRPEGRLRPRGAAPQNRFAYAITSVAMFSMKVAYSWISRLIFILGGTAIILTQGQTARTMGVIQRIDAASKRI